MKYEINQEIVFSTAHITNEDAEYLADINTSNSKLDDEICGDVYRYGFRILAISKEEAPEESFLSKEFWHLMHITKTLQCKWLVLDQDGLIHDNLEEFDW